MQAFRRNFTPNGVLLVIMIDTVVVREIGFKEGAKRPIKCHIIDKFKIGPSFPKSDFIIRFFNVVTFF